MVLVAVPTAVAVAQASASVELAGVQVVVLDVVVELLASELGPLDDARPGLREHAATELDTPWRVTPRCESRVSQ